MTSRISYNGWKNCYLLTNGEMEMVVTADVGPRIARLGFKGGRNMFAEMSGEQGKCGEKKWKLRGGHRFWIAPERKPDTYEPDNACVKVVEIPGGIRTVQQTGVLTGVQKTMDITISSNGNEARILHTLTNRKRSSIVLAPWALTVMAPGGMAVIPLPEKISHTKRLSHNQEWSIWSYTDLRDPRWMLGSRYVFFRQDRKRPPSKLGIAHREGWVAYLYNRNMFVKRFKWLEGAVYPDGGVNFETFSNEDFLELESLGPLVTLSAGKSVTHEEIWELHRNVRACRSEADADKYARPLIARRK